MDRVWTRFISKSRLYGFNKNLRERVQTRCNMRRIDTRLEKISKCVWTQFFYRTCLNAIRKKNNRVSSRFWKTFNAFKCILFTNCVQTRRKYFSAALGRSQISERLCTCLFLVYQRRFYPKNCCSRRVNCVIKIISLHIFYSSKLHQTF